MGINESRIRQIIKEEATRVLREADDDLPGPKFPPGSVKRPGLAAFGDFEPPEGWDDEEDEDEGPSHGGPGGFYGGYDDSGLVHLDSGDKELDDMWESWASLTLELYKAHGSKSFNTESSRGKQTVAESMVEFIEHDLPSEF